MILLRIPSDPRIAQYLPLVKAKARRFVRAMWGTATVDDLVAVGMVAVWEATKSFNPDRECSFGTWVSRCVHWAMSHEHKRAHKPRRGARVVKLSIHADGDDDLGIEIESPLPLPWEQAEESARAMVLVEAIATLPPDLQFVIEQHYFWERTFEQIGAEVGVSKQAIHQREALAIRLLRQRLMGIVEGGEA